ncbi:MAG: SDR family oxidoreductase [Lapillicoccus sp.]
MADIAIIGGHGKVALRLARLLTGRGDSVTSWVRNPDHVAEVQATGARALLADLEAMNLDEMTGHLAGHSAVVWAAGAGGGDPQRTYAVDRDAAARSMDAADAAGVRRFIMVSYFYDRPNHGVPQGSGFYAYAEAKVAADDQLRASDLDYVILGPSRLTDNPGTGRIETGETLTKSSVSRDDVAAVVAHILATPSVSRVTIDFNTGDTPIADAIP